MGATRNKAGQNHVNGDSGATPAPEVLAQDFSNALESFRNGLTVETQTRKTVKPITLDKAAGGAGAAMARDWALKAGMPTTGDQFDDAAVLLAQDLAADLVATSVARMLEMARALEVSAAALEARHLEVSKSNGRVSVRAAVRDVESGASASVSIPLKHGDGPDGIYARALATVAPERKA